MSTFQDGSPTWVVWGESRDILLTSPDSSICTGREMNCNSPYSFQIPGLEASKQPKTLEVPPALLKLQDLSFCISANSRVTSWASSRGSGDFLEPRYQLKCLTVSAQGVAV
jgi:hypothetical protein